jgi:cellulose synthase/poly-beta-1,6-N-acetylglucosamine synthase-like glycosyltransferase
VGWKVVSILFFLLGVAFLVWFALDRSWPIYAAAFCIFVAILTFLVSIFARRGSTLWQGRGKG